MSHFDQCLGQIETRENREIRIPILKREIEHIFATKFNTKKPLLKPLDINIKEQHCGVNKFCFLFEHSHPKY